MPHSLNLEQQRVVDHSTGHAVVSAAPGGGKTTILTERIARLIRDGANPSSITAITFTNKAAKEIRQRVGALCGDSSEGATMGTFHALGLSIIKAHGALDGLPAKPSILDTDDSRALMRQSLRNLGIEVSKKSATLDHPKFLAAVIDEAKRGGMNAKAFSEAAPKFGYSHGLPILLATAAFLEYERLCRAQNAFDFDDLILVATKLLRHDSVREALSQSCQYLLVDEFQDTSEAQYALMQAVHSQQVIVIGDPLQSIYGWRGATPAIFERFTKDHAPCSSYTVGINYRSSTAILAASNALMLPVERVGMTGVGDLGTPVRLHTASNAESEAKFIAEELQFKALSKPLEQFAILVRSANLTRPLERALAQAGIAYRLIGGATFWKRIEIRVAVALLRLALNPLHQPALEYAIAEGLKFAFVEGTSKLSLGDTSLEKLKSLAHTDSLPLLEVLNPEYPHELQPRAAHAAAWIHTVGMPGLFDRETPSAFLHHALTLWGYWPALEAAAKDNDLEAQGRLEALYELLALAESHERDGGNLETFAEVITLERSQQALAQGEAASAVTISTIHAAKGLEWDVVIIPGLEQGVLPSGGALRDDTAHLEERRVLFVAMTRAREELLLTRALVRRVYGELQTTTPSQYLEDLHAHLVTVDSSAMVALMG